MRRRPLCVLLQTEISPLALATPRSPPAGGDASKEVEHQRACYSWLAGGTSNTHMNNHTYAPYREREKEKSERERKEEE